MVVLEVWWKVTGMTESVKCKRWKNKDVGWRDGEQVRAKTDTEKER